ncbi:antA/AntB antirepressor family protein [Weissella kandleri]|uniref:antA/AntB antirepressor family protein n=1 Tax=Weissella kandleri TaxID=1616 RepID=UPI00387EE0F8
MKTISPVIDINTEDDFNQWVSARDLHEFLQVKKDFKVWVDQVNRMFDYDFMAMEVPKLTPIGNNYDYVVPIDTAIEIANMLATGSCSDNKLREKADLLWQVAVVTKIHKMDQSKELTNE